MARVAYRSADVDLMARMMRAEAEGEGKQGMLICRKCHCEPGCSRLYGL